MHRCRAFARGVPQYASSSVANNALDFEWRSEYTF